MLRHVHVLLATKCILRKEGKISMLEQQQQEIQQSNATIPNNRKYHNTRRLNTRKLFDFYLYTHTCIQYSPPGEHCSPSVSLPLHCIYRASVKVQVLYHIRSIHEHLKTFVPFYWLMPMTTYIFLSWASKQRACECLQVSVWPLWYEPPWKPPSASKPHSFIFPRETRWWRWWWWQYLGCNFIFFSFLRSVLY